MRISDGSSDVCSSDLADPSRFGVRFGLPDNLVSDRLIIFIKQSDCGAEDDFVTRESLGINDLRAAQLVFYIRDGGFHLSLPLLGGVIFGIFRKIGRASCRERVCQYV